MTSSVRFGRLASGLTAALLVALVFPRVQEAAQPSSPTLTVPAGFEVERVAGPPLVDRPIVADFDERAGSTSPIRPARTIRSRSNSPTSRIASSGWKTPTATAGSTSAVFADKMMFPEGTMWLDGSLYVAAPPSIWKLTDTDGDGVADKREEWFEGKTLTGCANDLHGPYLGPDGWIYWCKGAFAKQTLRAAPASRRSSRGPRTFSAGGRATGIEAVMTGGMDNPVDVAFTPGGERIFTTTFLQHPRRPARRADPRRLRRRLRQGPRRARRSPVHRRPDARHDPPGPGRPVRPDALRVDAFGAEYHDNLFAASSTCARCRGTCWSRRARRSRRATPISSSPSNRDFHPTDVIEDADGSLLVGSSGSEALLKATPTLRSQTRTKWQVQRLEPPRHLRRC